MRILSRASALGLAAGLMVASAPAAANITFSDATGGYRVGIGPNGELYDNTTGVGLQNPAGSDYIRPGTPRDSWGITGSFGTAFADYQFGGTSGITSTTTVAGTNSATLTSILNGGVTLRQEYNYFAPNILSIQQTVTNTGTTSVSGVVFRRNVDLDIAPTTFTENTTGPLGANASVVAASYFGFESANPNTPYVYSCFGGCNQVGDLGAGIDLGLGTIAAGESVTFAYYYGINQPGQTLTGLFAQAQGLGLSYLIGSQSTENGSFPAQGAGSGFLGVSNIGVIAGPGVVPEPATWAMMIGGMGLAGGSLRARRRKVAFATA